MCIKATIVTYVFSVQYFKNATIVVYAGLRVKEGSYSKVAFQLLQCNNTCCGYIQNAGKVVQIYNSY